MAYGNVRLSQQALEISHFFVNHHLEENNDKGEVWVHKTVMLLWGFAHEMWDHQNSVLHNTKLEASCAMHDAEINDAITKLYEKVETYSAED
jgi:hypothetical protein